MGNAIAYKVEDRSILLPYYKRFCVEPTLRLIPDRVNPNTITHLGHLACFSGIALLVGTHATRGWPFLAAMALLQFYNWCDNADGAHARRTGQCSVLGEFLDHGLDVLNTTYIGLMTIYALGSSPEYAVILACLIPGAASMVCWEQVETGVFRVGLLNQIESVMVLSATMVVAAVFGADALRHVHVGPLTVWQFMHLWPIATILFGMGHGMYRVHRAGASVAPALAFLTAHSAVLYMGVTHRASTLVAVALAVAVNVFFGVRMLSQRFRGERSRVEPLFVVGALGVMTVCGLPSLGFSLAPETGAALTIAACTVYGLSSIREARAGLATLAQRDVRR